MIITLGKIELKICKNILERKKNLQCENPDTNIRQKQMFVSGNLTDPNFTA